MRNSEVGRKFTFWVVYDATSDRPYVKMDSDTGCLAMFDNEECAAAFASGLFGAGYKEVVLYQLPPETSKKPEEGCDMSDLVKRLRIKAGMIEMGELIAWGSDSALMREAADALEMVGPAVQGEPVGWQFYQDGKWWYGDDRIKLHRKNTEAAGMPVRDVYAAPQPAEQQPRLAKYQPCGCVVCTCEHETQCQGCGARHCGTHPVGQILNPAYQQVDRQALTKIHASRNAADLHARNRLLADALEQILGWRELRSGREFPIERIEDIARAALAAYCK